MKEELYSNMLLWSSTFFLVIDGKLAVVSVLLGNIVMDSTLVLVKDYYNCMIQGNGKLCFS
jgi:hypothetical protein